MSCELIQVDFKKAVIKSRKVLDGKPSDTWVAAKDPDFKDYVSGIASMAKAAMENGGDWRRMIVIMHDVPVVGEEFCLTMWDGAKMDSAEVQNVLGMSISKVTQPSDGPTAPSIA